MNKPQDRCVEYFHDWNRADKAIACRKLSQADQARHEANLDKAESWLSSGKPDSLAGAGCLIQHAARCLAGMITFELSQSLLLIGGQLRKGRTDVAELRRLIGLARIADKECDIIIDFHYRAMALAMLSRSLAYETLLRIV
jgi:hypothetical protein